MSSRSCCCYYYSHLFPPFSYLGQFSDWGRFLLENALKRPGPNGAFLKKNRPQSEIYVFLQALEMLSSTPIWQSIINNAVPP